MDPVADAVLLVESGASAAHVGNATAVLIAHVEEHALELLVGVEAQRTVGTVEIQRHVRELLPPFGLSNQKPLLYNNNIILYKIKYFIIYYYWFM